MGKFRTPQMDWIVIALIVIGIFAFVTVLSIVALQSDEPDSSIIFSNDDMEIHAVCTVESGLLVTTQFNARIAGDSVVSVRMTDQEYDKYCVEGE